MTLPQSNDSSGSPRIKALAYIFTFTFLAVAILGAGWIVMPAYGATQAIGDPYDLTAAPHFRDVVYTLEKPSFIQTFDNVGNWKVSAGSPGIVCSASTFAISTHSNSLAQVSLYTSDASGTNITTQEYLEFAIESSGPTTGITLQDAAGNNASITFASASTITASYKNGAGTVVTDPTFYTSAYTNTYYRLGFELAATTISFYLYSENGTALANYVAVAPLHAGKLYEISVWHAGSSATTTLDWFYVSSNSPSAVAAVSANAVTSLSPDSAASKSNIRVDPTTLELVRSGSSMADQAYSITPTSGSDLNVIKFTSLYGSTPEPMQRVVGDQFAQGWNDFGSDLKTALIAKIASTVGVASSKIYLIDYYVDYIQLKTTIDPTIATKEDQLYSDMVSEAMNALGYGPDTKTAAGTPLTVDAISPYALGSGGILAYEENNPNWWKDVLPFVSAPAAVALMVSDGINNVKNTVTSTINAWNPATIANETIKSVMSAIGPYLQEGMNMTNALFAVINSTTAAFSSAITSGIGSVMSWSASTIANLDSGYNSTVNQLTNLNQQYMTWANQQLAATNAMFSQIFGKMNDQANATQQYFAGQLDKSNEALTNVTNSLNGMWSGLLSNGKVSTSTPLTLSGIFGTGLLGNYTFDIVLVIIVIIAVVAFAIYLSGKGKRRRRR